MRMLIVTMMLAALVTLAGCATSKMSSKKTQVDGTVIEYKVTVNSFGQDFKGSDLSASLDPEGETTVKAGAVDSNINVAAADAVKELCALIKTMLPYIAAVPEPTP